MRKFNHSFLNLKDSQAHVRPLQELESRQMLHELLDMDPWSETHGPREYLRRFSASVIASGAYGHRLPNAVGDDFLEVRITRPLHLLT